MMSLWDYVANYNFNIKQSEMAIYHEVNRTYYHKGMATIPSVGSYRWITQ